MRTLEQQHQQQHEADAEQRGMIEAIRQRMRENTLAAAFSGGLALAAFQEPSITHAAEIEPGANWAEGITELKNRVFQEDTESIAFFVITEEGYFWDKPMFENPDNSSVAVESVTVYLERIKKKDASLAKRIKKVCIAHTHNLAVSSEFMRPPLSPEELARIRATEVSTIQNLPSRTDMFTLTKEYLRLADLARTQDVDAPLLVEMVATPSGIIYFDILKNELIRKQAIESIATTNIADPIYIYAYNDSGLKIMNETRDAPASDVSLEEARTYAHAAGYDFRIVPYEKISEEPPCAGVEYVPSSNTNH